MILRVQKSNFFLYVGHFLSTLINFYTFSHIVSIIRSSYETDPFSIKMFPLFLTPEDLHRDAFNVLTAVAANSIGATCNTVFSMVRFAMCTRLINCFSMTDIQYRPFIR